MMDNIIVRQFAQDIDKLVMENTMLKKQIRKNKRRSFIFGAAIIVLGVEVYLINEKLKAQDTLIELMQDDREYGINTETEEN